MMSVSSQDFFRRYTSSSQLLWYVVHMCPMTILIKHKQSKIMFLLSYFYLRNPPMESTIKIKMITCEYDSEKNFLMYWKGVLSYVFVKLSNCYPCETVYKPSDSIFKYMIIFLFKKKKKKNFKSHTHTLSFLFLWLTPLRIPQVK